MKNLEDATSHCANNESLHVRHTPPSSGSPHRFARRPGQLDGTVFIAAMSQKTPVAVAAWHVPAKS